MWPKIRLNARKSTSVLVGSIGSDLTALAEADFYAYSNYYPKCTRGVFADVPKFLEMTAKRFQIVHLVCRIADSGVIIDEQGPNLPCSKLLDETYRHGAQLLFIAGENPKEAYINGVKLAGRNMNIIMTLDRRGDVFATFLSNLTGSIAAGEPMVEAWAKLAPQIPGASNRDLPACIFAAGLPKAVFLP